MKTKTQEVFSTVFDRTDLKYLSVTLTEQYANRSFRDVMDCARFFAPLFSAFEKIRKSADDGKPCERFTTYEKHALQTTLYRASEHAETAERRTWAYDFNLAFERGEL